MNQFLYETVQLWYWSLCCPSKLERRMHRSTLKNTEKDEGIQTDVNNWLISLLYADLRIIAQFSLIVLFLSIPLLIAMSQVSQLEDWPFFVLTVISAYCIGYIILPLGLHVPIFFYLFYIAQPQNSSNAAHLMPRFSLIQLTLGLAIVILTISVLFARQNIQSGKQKLGVIIFLVGAIFGVLILELVKTQNSETNIPLRIISLIPPLIIGTRILFGYNILTEMLTKRLKESDAIFISSIIGVFILGVFTTQSFGLINTIQNWNYLLLITTTLIVSIILSYAGALFGVLSFFLGIIAFFVSITAFIAYTTLISLPSVGIYTILFLMLFFGICMYPLRNLGLLTAISIIIVSPIVYLNGLQWSLLLLIIYAGYFRVFPNYPIHVIISRWPSRAAVDLPKEDLLKLLRQLPPHTDELLWLPLVGHDDLLLAASQYDAVTIRTLLQHSPRILAVGYQSTLNSALPEITIRSLDLGIRNLNSINTTADLLSSKTEDLVDELLLTISDCNLWTKASQFRAETIILLQLNSIRRNFLIASKEPLNIDRNKKIKECLTNIKQLFSDLKEHKNQILWKDVLKSWEIIIQSELIKSEAQIIAGDLLNVNTIEEITEVVKKIPSTYLSSDISESDQSDAEYEPNQDNNNIYTDITGIMKDQAVAFLLTQINTIVNNIEDAFRNDRALLIESSLVKLQFNINMFQREFLKKFSGSPTIDWLYPVITRWQKVIQVKIVDLRVIAVGEELASVKTIAQLINTATPDHPSLPLLLPSFYKTERLGETTTLMNASLLLPDPAIPLIFPDLLTIARDVSAALESGNAALKERGLERCFVKFQKLQRLLHSHGLDTQSLERWQAILEGWQAVVQAEFEQQELLSRDEIINPFQAGSPLQANRKYLFKGRKRFADDVVRQVLDRNRPTLVLHGPRRCGKTSFLLNLPRLLPSEMLPVYMDLQSAALTSSEVDFCFGLARAIAHDLRIQGIQLPAVERNQFSNGPYSALEYWLGEVRLQFKSRRVLLCLDEFEKLGAAISERRMSLRVFDELRHLIQHFDEIGFIFCGVQTLNEIGPNWSSYFISIHPIEMIYLEPREAEDVLTDPDPDFDLQYDVGIIERIIELTRCQPYLLQLIGGALVKHANQQQTKLITETLLDIAIESALSTGAPYFDNLWREYTGTTQAERARGQAILTALAQGQTLSLANDDLDRVTLQRLIRYHTLEYVQGTYRFEVPMVAQWVREQSILY